MSWNKYLYYYHKEYGGQFLAGEDGDGLLVLSYKDRPLVVDLFRASGRYGPYFYVQARIPVTLAKPYKLTVGAEKALSGGVNTVLRAVPGLSDRDILPADFGFPEVSKKRLIRSDNRPFTKLVLGSLDFRNALLASPRDRVEVRPGPGDEGLHLITVTSDDATGGSGCDWDLGDAMTFYSEEEETARQAADAFFPRMDRFLELTRSAYSAITQWPM